MSFQPTVAALLRRWAFFLINKEGVARTRFLLTFNAGIVIAPLFY
jgi:hypothetical protein